MIFGLRKPASLRVNKKNIIMKIFEENGKIIIDGQSNSKVEVEGLDICTDKIIFRNIAIGISIRDVQDGLENLAIITFGENT